MRSNNKVQVQINCLDSLEKLIGGNSEVEVDIRRNIVEKFAKKYLKAVANTAMFNGLKEHVHNLIYDNKSYYSRQLKPEFKTMIANAVDDNVMKMVESRLDKAFKRAQDDYERRIKKYEREYEAKIKEFEEQQATKMLHDLQTDRMNRLIDAKVERKFKTMLKLINSQDDGETTVKSINDIN